MVAGLIANFERLHRRDHRRAPQRQPVRRVIGDGVAAFLCFQQQREGGIPADVDPLDRVHLHGNVQGHHSPEDTFCERKLSPDRISCWRRKPRGYGAEYARAPPASHRDRKSTRLNSSHITISYAVFCLKKKKKNKIYTTLKKKKKINITTQ